MGIEHVGRASTNSTSRRDCEGFVIQAVDFESLNALGYFRRNVAVQVTLVSIAN